ncbi:MAG: hypothetical protein JRN16_02670 [Nitrososphaerota archaeon]|nr:hypothetical protein [Nitrososphaerota archaeon]
MSAYFTLRRQIQHNKQTIRDSVYIGILKREGPLSIIKLANIAKLTSTLQHMDLGAIERDLCRFTDHYETIGPLVKKDAKIHWVQADLKSDSPTATPQAPLMLTQKGFLTGKPGVTCEHCGYTIDLTVTKPHWRIKSRLPLLALQERRYFRVNCFKCDWEGKYDTHKDVKPIL